MAPLALILLISLASTSVAFGLNTNQRASANLARRGSYVAKSSLLMASDAAPVDVVAAKPEPKKGFMANFWNDQTQLFTYLTVWYLGNIYCKLLTC